MKRWHVRLEVENLGSRLVPSATRLGGATDVALLPAVREMRDASGQENALIGLLREGDANGLIGLLRDGDEKGLIGLLHTEKDAALQKVAPDYMGGLYDDLLNRSVGDPHIADFPGFVGGVMPNDDTGLPAVQTEALQKVFEQLLNRDTDGEPKIDSIEVAALPMDQGDERGK